jgi:hypothetical protein
MTLKGPQDRTEEGGAMIKRILKYGKWIAVIYVAQAVVGIVVGVYLVVSGVGIPGLGIFP